MGRHHENINRVPAGQPNLNDQSRKVFIASRFVGGRLGAWTAGLVLDIISGPKIPFLSSMPSPNYHWCVVVGDFYHQLQAAADNDKNHWNWYENERTSWKDKWELYEVGTTNFNDVAIAAAGVQAIESMPELYELVHNNCQKFTLSLLDLICRNGRKKVYTSWSRWTKQAGFVPGSLDSAAPDEEKEIEVAVVVDGMAHYELLENVESIMLKHTPRLTIEDIKAGKLEEAPAGQAVEAAA